MIVIGWSGLPNYAASCINSIRTKKKILVLTNNPNAKKIIKNADVKIVNLNKKYDWSDFVLNKPSHFFFTGWNNNAFLSLAKQRGTKNICMIDNYKKNNLRQFFGKIYFKIFLEKFFDAVFVPGIETSKFLKYFGFNKKIYPGLYTCDENIFFNKIKINKRKYDFIFVGQFIHRKNYKNLIKSFHFLKDNYDNKISLVMVGHQNKKVIKKNNLLILPFLKPNKLAEYLNNSKCLVLPSYEDHWGVVVHEAIRCGCSLILSNKVGSRKEFLKKNGFYFNINLMHDLTDKMLKFIKLKKNELNKMSNESIKLSNKRSVKIWIKQFNKILNEV